MAATLRGNGDGGGHAHDRTMLQKLGFADPDRKSPKHDWAVQYLSGETQAKRLVELYAKGGRWNGKYTYWHHEQPEYQLMKGEGKYRTTLGYVDLAISFRQVMTEAVDGTDPKRWLRNPDQVKVEGVWFDGEPDLEGVVYDPESNRWRRGWMRPLQEVEPPPFRGTGRNIAGPYGRGVALWVGHQKYEAPEKRCWAYQEPDYTYTKGWIREGCLIVEVKTGQQPIGDAIRQIALYREYGAALSASYYGTRVPDSQKADEWDCDSSVYRYILATTYSIDTEEARVLKQANIEHIRLGAAFEQYCEEREENRTTAESVEI